MSTSSDLSDDAPRAAFPVPDADILRDHEGPPTTAEQYLAMVRNEAAAMPNVFVSRKRPPSPSNAPLRERHRPHLRERLRLPDVPGNLCPDENWQRELVTDFCTLQEALSRAQPPSDDGLDMPLRGDLQSWTSLVFGVRRKDPELPFLLALDYLRAVDALKAIDGKMDVKGYESMEDSKRIGKSQEAMQWLFNGPCARWIFALLALIEPPTTSGTASLLRSLLRKACIARLASLDQFEPNLPQINVLITILEKHYGQGDML